MIKNVLAIMLFMVISVGCEEDALSEGQVNAFFFTKVDGALVEFDNLSRYGQSYLWDYGDGTTSTVSEPTYKYTRGGQYTVTLTTTGYDGTTTDDYSKVINVGEPTIIIDGDLSDWEVKEYLDASIVNGSSMITQVKVASDKQKVSILIEGTSAMSAVATFQLLVNGDGDHTTGYIIANLVNSGIELRMTGAFVGSQTSLWTAMHTHAANGWGFATHLGGFDNASGHQQYSDLIPIDGGYAIEFSISKTLLKEALKPGQSLGDGISFNLVLNNGAIPELWKGHSQIPILF